MITYFSYGMAFACVFYHIPRIPTICREQMILINLFVLRRKKRRDTRLPHKENNKNQ